jgi:hypothetical protein
VNKSRYTFQGFLKTLPNMRVTWKLNGKSVLGSLEITLKMQSQKLVTKKMKFSIYIQNILVDDKARF